MLSVPELKWTSRAFARPCGVSSRRMDVCPGLVFPSLARGSVPVKGLLVRRSAPPASDPRWEQQITAQRIKAALPAGVI